MLGDDQAVAPPRGGGLPKFCDFRPLFFFPSPSHRPEVTLAHNTLCIFRRGSVDTRPCWGFESLKLTLRGSPYPKTVNFSPPIGKSQPNIIIKISQKRFRIEKKFQQNTYRKSGSGFQNPPLNFICGAT